MDDHGPDCDSSHTPRQRCNTLLRANGYSEPEPPEELEEFPQIWRDSPVSEADIVPVSSQREAITATEMPAASSYVAVEWGKTVAAVSRSEYSTPGPIRFDPPARLPSRRQNTPLVALTGLLAAAGICAYLLRNRRDTRDDSHDNSST